MSELATTVREAIAALAASDRARKRFGAAQHGYELAPPIPVAEVERTLGVELPEDVRVFVTEVASGGAGPGYGWLPIQRATEIVTAAPAKVGARSWDPAAWTRALPIAHLGCGYAAVLPLDGGARGEIWIDARAIELVAPIHTTFTAMYLAWIDRLARGALPDAYVRPGVCAFSAALSGYLGVMEQRLGLPESTLAGDALRDVLAQLGPGAIEIAAESTGLFAIGDRLDPCLACAHLIETLAGDGLRRDVIAAGTRPRPLR
ncbi:MAG: hypothetical protein JWP01_2108 [Myxococcales bacterium]|nr:hypothetical protein [Myxococcales bacterium]